MVRVIQGPNLEIDVEIRPVQMDLVKQPNVDNALDRSILEPWILRVREEVLLVEHEQPNAGGRNI